MRPNRIRKKLDAGACVLGPNLQIESPWLVEIIGHAGFDFVMLDGEHGAAFSNLQVLILAADAAGITPIVRVPSHDRGYLIQALEAGAGGVQVPMVNTPDEARYLVREAKYAPVGNRGFSHVTRAADYGGYTLSEYAPVANRETMLILQLGTKEALANAVEIAQVSGVDMLFFGPADLAQSMGFPGESQHPDVIAAMQQVIKQIRSLVPVGISAFSAEDVRLWKKAGAQSFLTSSMHPMRQAFERVKADLERGLA